MLWFSDICDKVIYEEFRSNHFESGFHKRSANSIVRRYIINNPKPNKINNRVKRFLRLHHKKYD